MRHCLVLVLACLCFFAGCKRKSPPAAEAPQHYEFTYQVGAFANPDNAAALKRRLAAKGFVVSTEKAEVGDASFERVLVHYRGPLEFTYQAGAFSDRANAEALAAEIKAKGVDAEIDEAVVDGATYHRVYVRTQSGVEELLERLKASGAPNPMFRDIRPL